MAPGPTGQPAADSTKPARRSLIQRRAAIAAFLLGLVPVLAVSTAGYLHQRNALAASALDRLEAVASVQEARLEAYLDGNLQSLALVVSRTQFRVSLAEFLRTGDPQAQAIVTRILSDARDSSPTLHAIHAVGADGRVAASTDPDRVGADVSRESYFIAGIGAPTVGRVVATADARMVHVVAGPIALEDAPAGVLVIEAGVEPLLELVGDYTGLGSTGETQLVGRADHGDVFLAPLRFDEQAALRRFVTRDPSSLAARALAGEETVTAGARDYRGKAVFGATRHIARANWGVVVKIDESEALLPVRDFRAFAGAIMILAVAAVAAAAWLGAGSFTRPIVDLTEAAGAISEGDRRRRVPEDRRDELGTLAAAFNRMTNQLTETATSLEEQSVKLQHRTTALERSNRELEEFASVAAHDLQEPLRKVRAFSDRLMTRFADFLPEQGQSYLQRIHDASERMQRLINDLLTLSRVTTQAVPFEPVSLNDLTAQVLEDLSLLVQETGARIDVGDLPTLDADPAQMRELLQNLISNAIKYRRPDVSPHVTITADPAGEGLGSFSVRDNGIGFEAQYAERIFRVFERLHGMGEFEGTGIGLAVCKKIVERHGGSITATSTPGEGSTFAVTLPLRHREPAGG
jgi:signal transduction histidine kinase